MYASYMLWPPGKRLKVHLTMRIFLSHPKPKLLIRRNSCELSISETIYGTSIGHEISPPPLFSDGTILGETQWSWLENELNGPQFEITFIASSIRKHTALFGWQDFISHSKIREYRAYVAHCRSSQEESTGKDDHVTIASVSYHFEKVGIQPGFLPSGKKSLEY